MATELDALGKEELAWFWPLQRVIAHRRLVVTASEIPDAERERFLMLTDPLFVEYEKRLLDRGERKGKLEGKREGKLEGKREGKLEGKREGKLEGKLEGKAEAVVAVLQARGLTATDEQRKRILECQDAAQLDTWLRESVTCILVSALLSGSIKPVSPRSRKRPARS